MMMAAAEPERPGVLLVHDTYSTSKVEIFNINRRVGLIIRRRQQDISVYSTILKATEEDMQNAKDDGVELLLPKRDPLDTRAPSLGWLTFDHRSRYPDLPSKIMAIVGYAGITGRAAATIRNDRYPKAKFILFNTDIPEDTEYYKGDEEAMGIGKKEDSILEDAKEADVVFSVGNMVFDHFENQFRAIPAEKQPNHFMFAPRPSKMFEVANAQYKDVKTMIVLFIGKAKGAEKVKGYDLAVEAMNIVAKKRKVQLRVIGGKEDDFNVSTTILQDRALQVTFIPYDTQVDICKHMKQAHLVLMPSRAEPFGLVGLEAIAAGVPVLVPSNSGLADLINEHVEELHNSIINMDEIEEGTTAEHLARSIERKLKHCRAEFRTAARCKQDLLSTKYWEESHQKFFEACIGAASSPSDRRPTDDDGTQQSRSAVVKKRKRSAGHTEESKEDVKPLKRAQPDAMALSIHAGTVTAVMRSPAGDAYYVFHEEQIHSDVQQQDFLTRMRQELARGNFSVEERKKILKIKEQERDYEREGIYLQGKMEVDVLNTATFLPQNRLEAKVDQILEKIEQKGAKVIQKYQGCVILFLDFETKSRFEKFWGFYSSGGLSDIVAEQLITDQTSRMDSGELLVARAMVLKEDLRAWRDFFEKEEIVEASPEQRINEPCTVEPFPAADFTRECSPDLDEVPATDTDENEEASHEQRATRQPTIRPVTFEPPIGIAAKTLDITARLGQLNLDTGSKGSETPLTLCTAAQLDNLPAIRMLIDKGADVNMEDEEGRTSVWAASKSGYTATIEMLIAKGADVNKADKKGRTPLWVAAKNDHVSVEEMLITKGAHVNMADKEGRAPLWVAAQNGHIPTIETLISKGAKVNMADEEGRTPLWVAAQKDSNLSTVETLISKGANVNLADEDGRTSLWVAAQNGCFSTAKLLISRGANVNKADDHSQTPLWVAAQWGHLQTVELLFSKGADVNAIDEDAQTSLWIAAQEGHLPVVEMLLRNGVDVNMADKDGQPPLWIASQEGHHSVVDRLLSKGAEVNVADVDHQTPLSVAAQWDHISVVEKLLGKGADVNMADKDGRTPLWIAALKGHLPTIKMLLSKGADVNMADKDGRTPLWIAALKGHLPTIKMLLSKGADVNMADNYGKTPLWIALQFGQHTTVEVLLSNGAVEVAESGGGTQATIFSAPRKLYGEKVVKKVQRWQILNQFLCIDSITITR